MSGLPVAWDQMAFGLTPPTRSRKTHVSVGADGRLLIETDSRRASAIMQVMAGASMAEVGAALGVSRERIRQYLLDAQLSPKDRIRLLPETARSRKERGRFIRARRCRQRQKAVSRARLRLAAGWIAGFARQHGRAPYAQELADALSLHYASHLAVVPVLCQHFGHTHRWRRPSRLLALAYRWAGVEQPKPGSGRPRARADRQFLKVGATR